LDLPHPPPRHFASGGRASLTLPRTTRRSSDRCPGWLVAASRRARRRGRRWARFQRSVARYHHEGMRLGGREGSLGSLNDAATGGAHAGSFRHVAGTVLLGGDAVLLCNGFIFVVAGIAATSAGIVQALSGPSRQVPRSFRQAPGPFRQVPQSSGRCRNRSGKCRARWGNCRGLRGNCRNLSPNGPEQSGVATERSGKRLILTAH
jgi:hypothetical protein